MSSNEEKEVGLCTRMSGGKLVCALESGEGGWSVSSNEGRETGLFPGMRRGRLGCALE